MACNECKQKSKLSDDFEKQISNIQNGTKFFIIVWILFGLVGLILLFSIIL